MNRISIALYVALAVASAAHAQTCAAPVVQQHVVQQYQTVTPVVAHVNEIAVSTYVPVVAVQVAVPSYSASYGPPMPAQLSPEAIELLRQMGARLDGIETYLRAANAQPPVMPPAPVQPPAPQPPLQPKQQVPIMPGAQAAGGAFQSCIRCHDGDASKGGGHALFANGLPLAWDCSTMLELQDRITRDSSAKGAMPPDGGATDDQVAAMIAALKLQARQVAKK